MEDSPRSPRSWIRGLSPARRLPPSSPTETPSPSPRTSRRPPSSRKSTSLQSPRIPKTPNTPETPKPIRGPSSNLAPTTLPTLPKHHTPTPTLNIQQHAPIIHKILTFSPRRLLLTFRQTSRSLRRKADAILAHHLIITTSSSTLTITSPLGSVPGLIWLPTHTPNRTQQLLYTKILDLRGPIDAADTEDLGLSHIPTVRFRENSAGHRPQSCNEGHTRIIAFATLEPSPRCPLLCPVPESARSLTVSLRCFAGCPSPMPPFHHPAGLRRVTFIFRTAPAPRVRGRRSSAAQEQQLGLVPSLARVIVQAPVVRYTLVDLHLLDATNLGFPLLAGFGRLEEGYARRKVLEAVEAGIRREFPFVTDEEVEEALGAVEFLEMGEYARRVGYEVFQMEVVENMARQ